MANDIAKPFDNRLLVAVQYKDASGGNAVLHMPFSDRFDVATDGLLMPLDTLLAKKSALKKAGVTDDEFDKAYEEQVKQFNIAKENPELVTVPALMNPYAQIRLIGSVGGSSEHYKHRLIDSSTQRPWYEANIINSDNIDYGYSKMPTTARLIEWGKNDTNGKTPYQFQDFVFCKWWNKIPNNRLITLRRYAMPILDNLSIPSDESDSSTNITSQFPPLATAVTYFGEETGNSLNEILKFSTGLNWGDTSANVWDVEGGDAVSTKEALEGAGGALKANALFSGLGHALNGLSILNNNFNNAGLQELNGIPPDPYQNGPYENRIKGPVNRIDSVKRREAGLKFEMSGLKIKFSYVARPIGGINSKAVLLDILSNFMLMGSASAVFFGGAHRFRVKGTRFPAFNHEAIRKWYSGDLLGGAESMFDTFSNAITGDYDGNNFLQMIVDVGKGLWADLMNLIGNPFGYSPDGADTSSGQKGAAGIKRAVMQKMHTGMRVPYLQGMRALLTGEPVGDWHLTIGNPMNPIAMIGNLICTNIEVEFDEEAGLGPDDFPLGFTVTVSLEHGMPRDRDGIESMFNKGSGRIYVVPSEFVSSGDKETTVDKETGKNNPNPEKTANTYVTTKTSSQNIIIDINKNNSSPKYIKIDRKLKNDNIYTVGFKDESKLSSRIPYHAAVEWITKKGFN